MINIINQIAKIDWTEGVVNYIFYDYRLYSEYPLFVICSGGWMAKDLRIYLFKCLDIVEFHSSYPPTGISEIEIIDNELIINDFSDLFFKVKAKSFELYDLGNIEIKNPYQLLIDLELIKQ